MHAIVHIGLHKTGTTSIQASLAKADRHLLDQGVYFPTRGGYNHSNQLKLLFGQVEERRRVLEEIDRREGDWGRDNFLPPEGSGAQTVIFSAEGLSSFPPHEREAFAAWVKSHFDRITLVAYTRDPVGFTSSMAQERLKSYLGETLAQVSANPPMPHYQKIIGAWQEALEPTETKVFDFAIASRAEGGLFRHFCANVGIELTAEIVAAEVRRNESLSLPGAYMLSALNTEMPVLLQGGARNPDRPMSDHLRFTGVTGPKFRLPAAVERRVVETLAPEIEWLRVTFGIDYTRVVIEDDIERIDLDTANNHEWFTLAKAVLDNAELIQDLDMIVAEELKNVKTKTIRDLVDAAKAQTEGLENMPAARGVALLKAAFEEIRSAVEASEDGVLRVAGFGAFRVRQAADGSNHIGFVPASDPSEQD